MIGCKPGLDSFRELVGVDHDKAVSPGRDRQESHGFNHPSLHRLGGREGFQWGPPGSVSRLGQGAHVTGADEVPHTLGLVGPVEGRGS